MSRIFKASRVKIDVDNAVNIEIMDSSQLAAVEQAMPAPAEAAPEEEEKEQSPEQVLAKADREARELLEKARRDAKKAEAESKARAEEEAAALFVESREKGYQEGYEAGLSQTEGIKREAQQVYENALAEREKMLNAAEGDAVRLITDILDKLLGSVVKINPMLILALVRQGLASVTTSGEITVHVSGKDYETVIKHREEILPLVDGSAVLEFLKDLSLNQGDCIIETPFGNVDSSLNQQYQALKQDLYYLLESPAGDAP